MVEFLTYILFKQTFVNFHSEKHFLIMFFQTKSYIIQKTHLHLSNILQNF